MKNSNDLFLFGIYFLFIIAFLLFTLIIAKGNDCKKADADIPCITKIEE